MEQLLPPTPIYAKAFLLACDAPLWHPYTLLRTAEVLIKSAGADPRGKPSDARKIVATLPRNDGTEQNGGRR